MLRHTVRGRRLDSNNVGSNIPGPEFIRLLSPAAWFRHGVGITVTGAGVSQWDDQSGNARHLKQATDTNRPALQADGSILFDGVDNFLKCDAFTLNQPETVYFLGKQVTWTNNDYFFDGEATNSGYVAQVVSSPRLEAHAGGSINTEALAVDTYGVIAVVFNGASSVIQVNNNAPTTGNAGAANMGGFTLGSRGAADGFYGNIRVKEVILYAAAHDAARRARVISYLKKVGGI